MKRTGLILLLALLLALPCRAWAEAGRPLYAAQGDDGQWGYIDSLGRWVIAPQYDAAWDFQGDYARASLYPADADPEDEFAATLDGIIDVTGAWVLEPEYTVALLTESGVGAKDSLRVSEWQNSARINGWFNLTNGFYTGLIYERLYGNQQDSADGRALLVTRGEDGAWAYMNSLDGEALIPFQPEAEKAGNYAEGYVLVKDHGHTALVDGAGSLIRPADGLEIPEMAQVSEGLIQVKDPESALVGFMNTAGETVIAPAYAWADDFGEAVACVQFPEGDYGHIDKNGNVLWRGAPQRYSFSHGLAALPDDDEADTLVFIRTNGEEAFRVTAEGMYDVEAFQENGVAVYQSFKMNSHYNAEWDYTYYTFTACGLVSQEGAVLTEPIFYRTEDPQGDTLFSEGLAPIGDAQTLLMGYIDEKGQWVIPPQYDSAGAFRDGLARVQLGGETLFIDREGNKLFPGD